MKLKYIMLIATSSILSMSNVAFAVTADDVVCSKCVDASDISAGAVTSGKLRSNAVATTKIQDQAVTRAKIAAQAVNRFKIAPLAVDSSRLADAAVTSAKIASGAVATGKLRTDAVTTGKIADGAVTEAKLSAAVQSKLNATGGGLPTYDRIIGTATQRVYNLAGDFTSGGPSICQTAGSDTEVQDIVRTTVTGGILIEVTRTRFNGGTGGTKCHHQVLTFFNNGTESTLVKRVRYNSAGTTVTQTDEFLDFDAVNCSDCGIIVREDGMSQGLLLATGGILTSKDGSNVVINEELAISFISLQEVNDDVIINEGEISEQTFTGCNAVLEDRTSSNIGSHKTYRVYCPTIGRTEEFRRRTDGKSQMWELTSYTAP